MVEFYEVRRTYTTRVHEGYEMGARVVPVVCGVSRNRAASYRTCIMAAGTRMSLADIHRRKATTGRPWRPAERMTLQLKCLVRRTTSLARLLLRNDIKVASGSGYT